MATTQDHDNERVKGAMRERWSAAAAARQKWRDRRAAINRPETEALLAAARLRAGMQVLDVAGGAGEPALRAAEPVGPTGHVTCTDLAPKMLAVAEEFAQRDGRSNISFEPADMEALPFEEQQFDAVTCRLGLMYCAHPTLTLRETRRVLKAGGRAAYLTLGPLNQNPFMTAPVAPLQRRATLPPTGSTELDVFRFADPNVLAGELRAAGFQQVEAEAFHFQVLWPGSAEELLAFQQEFHGLWQPLMQQIPIEQRKPVIAEVLDGFRQFSDGQQLTFPAVSVVASGRR